MAVQAYLANLTPKTDCSRISSKSWSFCHHGIFADRREQLSFSTPLEPSRPALAIKNAADAV